MRLPALALAILLTACVTESCRGQDRLSAGWPEWQWIEASEPPADWRMPSEST